MRHSQLSQVAQVALVMPPSVRMASAGIFLDTFELARNYVRDLYGEIDVLPAADKFDVAEVHLLSVDGERVSTVGGVVQPPGERLNERRHDIVCLADFTLTPKPADEGITPFSPWLQGQFEKGAVIAASGNAVGLVAAAGLLDGKRAAAPEWLAKKWSEAWPKVAFDPELGVVEDGNMITCRGGATDADLAVRLVTSVTSANTGRWLASRQSIEFAGGRLRPRQTDSLLVRAQDWLAGRFSQKVTIDQLAAAMDVNRRTLHRHFVAGTGRSPTEYLQYLRIEAAKRMLERTSFSIDRIAALVGYDDTGFFRETFRRFTGGSPRAWRKNSAQASAAAAG